MTFVNYKNSNNASSKLLADISASATTVFITSWDETLFPNSFPFLLTIEKLNSDWKVIVREIVKATAWNQNSFTVVRWAWTCVQDDTASQRVQWNSTHSFSAWDRISLYWTAEQVKDIQDEMNTKLSIAEYQSWNYVYWASTTWNDDYAITLPFAPTAYAVWQVFRFLAWTANTWPATLNVNWLWAIDIKKNHDVALDTWDIEAWQIVEVAYDWTNFQMNSQTATIVDMKDIKTLSFSWLKAWQTLTEWDIVQISNSFNPSMATEANAYWWIAWLKGAIWFEANWDTIKDLQIKCAVASWTTPTSITVNLETDNNWAPSWTALSTVDLLSYLQWNVNISSVSRTVLQKTLWNTWQNNACYFGWWNRWKERCFYWKNNSVYINSSSTHLLDRVIINSDSSDATKVEYSVSWSTLLSVLWFTTEQYWSFLYVDQDFKFMFVFVQWANSIYKLWFNAPSSWQITDFVNLWSRSLSSVWINSSNTYLHTQIAFSDDWMFLYTLSDTDQSGIWTVHSYSLSSPYNLTWATEIWTGRAPWNYVLWPCYMSLWNWKNYIVVWVNYNQYIYAKELNSDWTIWNDQYTLYNTGSWNSAYFNWVCVWNYANGWAAAAILYHTSSADQTHIYVLWTWFFTSPVAIDFSLWTVVSTTEWQTYWLTFYPTWWSVENFLNLYSYWWEENTSLSTYTDSWSSVSNRSPYLKWNWVSWIYIVKQFETDLPFWTYWIIDNNYQAFVWARFVNMWISNHNTWLTPWKKYYMSWWKLSKTWWDWTQYLWTAISSTDLVIWTM